MPVIPPINVGALSVTFPANLPRNEKDLICMLLAGRLKDLWNGKLICAQLALMDLVKELSGSTNPLLLQLQGGLLSLNGSLANFKQASGYDTILSNVNKALGQVSNVFSLGGLCPSPIQAPKIPDILGALNLNLFGQASNILNALAQASNPKVCFGGGPKGFGIDWSQVKGSLANLKASIDAIKQNPAGYKTVINAFTANLQNQATRLNAEVKRLGQDLSDPLGINDKKNTVSNIVRTKEISGDVSVKDKNGITYNNVSSLMTTGEINMVLSRLDATYTEPVHYETVPVLDYCGVVTGYERKVVTGDPAYMGWDTIDSSFNTDTPTDLPVATLSEYDYAFVEENDTINVYNKENTLVPVIELTRGVHYKIGFKLKTKSIRLYNEQGQGWYYGVKILKEPNYGKGLESVDPVLADPTTFFMDKTTIEMDWSVQIENPTTPDKLLWKTSDNSLTGNIIVTGITAIPDADKTYDVSMSVNKAWKYLKHTEQDLSTIQTGLDPVKFEETYTSRVYNLSINVQSGTSQYQVSQSPVPYRRSLYFKNPTTDPDDTKNPKTIFNIDKVLVHPSQTVNVDQNGVASGAAGTNGANTTSNSWGDNGYTTFRDIETLDDAGSVIDHGWVNVFWYKLLDGRFFVLKKYFNDMSGIELSQITAYLADKMPENTPPRRTDTAPVVEHLMALTFDKQPVFLNDIRLPYNDDCGYKLSLPNNGKLENAEKFTLALDSADTSLLNVNLSQHSQGDTIADNEFIYTSTIQLDPTDVSRTYTGTDPQYSLEKKTFIHFKGSNGFLLEVTIELV